MDTFAEAREQDVLNLAQELDQNVEDDRKNLQRLFNRIDADGSGRLTLDELIEGARKDPELQSRLRVMDIDEVDLQQLFEMIDVHGEGAVEAQEFIAPLSRWVHESKTAPRFIKYNMVRTMQNQEELFDLSRDYFDFLAMRVDSLSESLQKLTEAQGFQTGGQPAAEAQHQTCDSDHGTATGEGCIEAPNASVRLGCLTEYPQLRARILTCSHCTFSAVCRGSLSRNCLKLRQSPRLYTDVSMSPACERSRTASASSMVREDVRRRQTS